MSKENAGELTAADLRDCATDIVTRLEEVGDPFVGDDWSMMQVARAYLAEHPADEDEPADHEWMESMGWAYLDMGCWLYKTADGLTMAARDYWYVGIVLNTVGQLLQIVRDETGFGETASVEMAVPCRTRGDIRRIHAVFGSKVAQ
jgi:hypothetical protein